MKLQEKINTDQAITNSEQNTLNEKTKVDISVRNFWGILIFVVGITTAYLVNNFRIASDIQKIYSTQERISANVEVIAKGLEQHLSESAQARRDMRAISDARDAHFNEIDKAIAGILARLQIQ